MLDNVQGFDNDALIVFISLQSRLSTINNYIYYLGEVRAIVIANYFSNLSSSAVNVDVDVDVDVDIDIAVTFEIFIAITSTDIMVVWVVA